MHISRLIALSTLTLLPALAAAQSSSAASPAQPPVAAAQSANPPSQSAAMNAQIYARLREQLQRERQHTVQALHAGRLDLVSPQHCYTLRDYNFTRNNPGSDATHLNSSSLCESASSVHLKSITPFAH